MEEGFQSLQQEVDIKTKKLKKVGKSRHIRTIFWKCDSMVLLYVKISLSAWLNSTYFEFH